MEDHSDWDLLAVVRSCTTTIATATATATTAISPSRNIDHSPPPPELPQPPILPQQEELICFTPTPSTCSTTSALFGFSSPLPTTSFLSGGQQELLQENINSSTNTFQSLSCSSMVSHQQEQLRRLIRPSHVTFGPSSPTVSTSRGGSTSGLRTKKRKNLMKKVCHVPAEGLFSDMWAWRKYGQKPIKGSPHPRGYYKCSSSKGCLARKQVERNRTHPKMFIITYTSEHNHPIPTQRNSLAGSTRQKNLTSTDTLADQPTCSSPSMTNQSPLTETPESKTEGENLVQNEDNDLRGLSDLMFNDDFHVGFERIDGGSNDSDCFSEQFSPSSEFQWLDNGSITATTTGES